MPWLRDEFYTKEKLVESKINFIIKALANLEGKKTSLNAGNCREVLACLKKLSKDAEFYKALTTYLIKG